MSSISVEQIISEISATPFYRDNPHLIDEASIYRWAFLALKSFGTQIMYRKETVVSVDNFRADLPRDFGRLSLAAFCEEKSWRVTRGSRNHLMGSHIYKEKLIGGIEDSACIKGDCAEEEPTGTCVIERIYFNDGEGEVQKYYTNPVYVKIGRNVLDGGCTSNCINKQIKDSPYSINIQGNKIQANFRTGKIYIEYFALPQNDEGIPVIPETKYGYLQRYIEQHIKRKLLEEGMLSKDAPNQQTMYQVIVREEQDLFVEAQKEAFQLDFNTLFNTIDENRKRRERFKVNLGMFQRGRVGFINRHTQWH